MIKKGIFRGEQEDLQDFLDTFYEAQGKKEVPEIGQGMDVILIAETKEHVKMFRSWATAFDLEVFFIETTR